MTLKAIFNTMKHDKNSIIARLDKFLVSNKEESDRAINVNSPSQVGRCKRANYWMRTGEETASTIDARTQRIFDNGTGMHERIQAYLKAEGSLVFDEIPLIDEDLNIQGHTDGLLRMTPYDYSILELKSINSNGFSKLKDAKEEHKLQAMVYLYCMEVRRQELREMSQEEFEASKPQREEFYASRYQHMKDGKKFTREEKIAFQVKINMDLDDLLYTIPKEIDSIVFLYENKDTQELKEFVVKYDEDMMCSILDYYEELNDYIAKEELPPREGTSKSCTTCRFCNYQISCWVV